MAETLRAQVAVKSSACNFWNGYTNANLLVKVAPDFYERIEIHEGDGISAGSIYSVHMWEGVSFAAIVKVKVVKLDTENKKATYDIIDGDLMKQFKTYKIGIEMIPKDDGEGSLVNWFCEYEKQSDAGNIPDPTTHRDATIKILKKIDAYLLKA